jgi:hypothetical protein
MSQTMKMDPVTLGIVLVIGAMIYSRSNKAMAGTAANRRAPGSLPANVGSGTAQVVGGLFGSLLANVTKPQSYWGIYQTPGYIDGAAAQEIAWDRSSPDVIVPASISTTGVEQDWTVG